MMQQVGCPGERTTTAAVVSLVSLQGDPAQRKNHTAGWDGCKDSDRLPLDHLNRTNTPGDKSSHFPMQQHGNQDTEGSAPCDRVQPLCLQHGKSAPERGLGFHAQSAQSGISREGQLSRSSKHQETSALNRARSESKDYYQNSDFRLLSHENVASTLVSLNKEQCDPDDSAARTNASTGKPKGELTCPTSKEIADHEPSAAETQQESKLASFSREESAQIVVESLMQSFCLQHEWTLDLARKGRWTKVCDAKGIVQLPPTSKWRWKWSTSTRLMMKKDGRVLHARHGRTGKTLLGCSMATGELKANEALYRHAYTLFDKKEALAYAAQCMWPIVVTKQRRVYEVATGQELDVAEQKKHHKLKLLTTPEGQFLRIEGKEAQQLSAYVAHTVKLVQEEAERAFWRDRQQEVATASKHPSYIPQQHLENKSHFQAGCSPDQAVTQDNLMFPAGGETEFPQALDHYNESKLDQTLLPQERIPTPLPLHSVRLEKVGEALVKGNYVSENEHKRFRLSE